MEVKTMNKILWMSRYAPLASQRVELARLFGDDVVVEQDRRPFDSAEQIVARLPRRWLRRPGGRRASERAWLGWSTWIFVPCGRR
jgi:hypothetical protein